MLTIISPDERVSVASPEFAVHKFLGLLQGDVHVAIDGLQLACVRFSQILVSKSGHDQIEMRTTFVYDTGIELHRDWRSDDLAEKARWIAGIGGTAIGRLRRGAHDSALDFKVVVDETLWQTEEFKGFRVALAILGCET